MKNYIKYFIDILKAIIKNSGILIPWAIIYLTLSWSIFYFIFQFNILSIYHWKLLYIVWKHGWIFHGIIDLTFFFCLLTFIPIFITSSVIIIRNNLWNKIKIWIPKISIPALSKKPESKTEEKPSSETPANETIQFPEDLPTELQKKYIDTIKDNISDKILTTTIIDNSTEEIINSDNPIASAMLPKDFNIDLDSNDDNIDNNEIIENEEQSNIEFKISDSEQNDNSLTQLSSELQSMKFKIQISDNLIIANKKNKHFVIASNDNKSMWIADESENSETIPMWFTEGAFKNSPTYEVLKKATDLSNNTVKYQPTLYLPQNNIMNLDELKPIWESKGLKIITSLTDLN